VDTLQAIATRRSVRAYTPELVTKAQLDELIDAAVSAPSGLNRQPWSFAIINDPAKIEQLEQSVRDAWLGNNERGEQTEAANTETSNEMRALIESGFAMFHGAPAAIICLAPSHDEMALLDTALAAGNLMLAAHALGLATCPVALTHPYLDHPATKAELGIPADLRVVLTVVLGTPSGPPPPRPPRSTPQLFWI
jgi:nitroreductase